MKKAATKPVVNVTVALDIRALATIYQQTIMGGTPPTSMNGLVNAALKAVAKTLTDKGEVMPSVEDSVGILGPILPRTPRALRNINATIAQNLVMDELKDMLTNIKEEG